MCDGWLKDPAILKRINVHCVSVFQICFYFSVPYFPLHLFAAFVTQMSVYDYIYMNMVSMIVMNVFVNVCAGFHQITLIKDNDDTVLLMIVCPFV